MRTIPRTLVTACTAVALALTGCGTKGGSGTPAADGSSAAGGASQHVDIGKSFWHAGWKVDLASATTKPLPDGGDEILVTVDAVFNNLGGDSGQFTSRMLLSGGATQTEPTFTGTQLPDVPGEAKQSGVIAFQVPKDFKLADAMLTVGEPGVNQAAIPFGSAGAPVTLEPRSVPVEISGSIVDNHHDRPATITLKVTGGELRADVPDKHEEVKKGYLALSLKHSVTYKYPSIYTYSWFGDNLLLELPDGTSVGPDFVTSVANIDPGATASDLVVRFLVKEPPTGNYKLILKSALEPKPRKAIPFSIT
jgi:hypothetical protein